MFCRIRDNKKTLSFTVYLCDRMRENGKVKTKDKKIGTFEYEELYEILEIASLKIFEGVPKFLKETIKEKVNGDEIKNKIVVQKLEEFKRKNYTTHMNLYNEKLHKKLEPQRRKYEKFKSEFYPYFLVDMDREYKKGYNVGKSEGIRGGSKNNININGFSESETKLLKEAINLLTKKNHPDRGGDHEKMVEINNLREKLFK